MDPQDTAEDRLVCLKFLRALFFGEDEMEKGDDQVYIRVPIDLLITIQKSVTSLTEHVKTLIEASNKLGWIANNPSNRITTGEENDPVE